MDGLNPQPLKEKEKYQFDTWVLHLPPVNLWNVDLVYLAFGYDTKYTLRKEYTNVYDEERF